MAWFFWQFSVTCRPKQRFLNNQMKTSAIFIGVCTIATLIFSCGKQNSSFNPIGGTLPTKYITILDSTFSPVSITAAVGSSFTFLNSSTSAHTIISDDTVTFITPSMLPGTSFFFKKDTIGTISYHCKEHPSARGIIILRP